MQTGNLNPLPKGTKVPDHIVIIPDGNRRWARSKGLTPMDGHAQGLKTLIKTLQASRQWGVHTATVWGLSTENWIERPEREVKFLMKIMSKTIDEYLKEAMRDGVRIVHLGRKDRLPKSLMDKIKMAEEKTKDNSRHVLNVALDYGGQDELVRAVKKMVSEKVKPEDIDIKKIDSYLDTKDQPYPYPDLIIRTSGEQRTSGILLWQSSYAETYWENDHFPDFDTEKLKDTILDFSRRRRRFGGNDQVNHLKFKPEVSAKLELAWWRLRKVPEGTRFRDFAVNYLREQYGLSKHLAKDAAVHMVEAILKSNEKDWDKSKKALKKFYRLIKDHLKLAFEPELLTSLRIKFWQEVGDDGNQENLEDIASTLTAEEYRISLFQAKKAAHLRVLANKEMALAEAGQGEYHWDLAKEYLSKYYKALKERVA